MALRKKKKEDEPKVEEVTEEVSEEVLAEAPEEKKAKPGQKGSGRLHELGAASPVLPPKARRTSKGWDEVDAATVEASRSGIKHLSPHRRTK